ncbi:MAG: NADH-quinone oxidoreductase subunit NuoN, partial [Alphaproteobacteria bacterium]
MSLSRIVQFDLLAIAPELILAVLGLAFVIIGLTRRGGSFRFMCWMVVGAFVLAGIAVLGLSGEGYHFRGLFRTDDFARFAKILILLGAGTVVLMGMDYAEDHGMARFELPILLLFSVLGMMIMVSANDLMTVYMGAELQALPLYVAAAIRRDTVRSTEAGLKYFVLGALSSGIMLYGMSLVYGFAGSTVFQSIGLGIIRVGELPIGALVGIVFVTAGLAFKVSAVPFHMWTPDVYEGAPTPLTAFFAVAPKMAAMALFLRVMIEPFGPAAVDWQQIIIAISALSMVLAAFAALAQSNIKRLMAYSSIGHMGYALIGLAAGTEQGVQGVLVYLSIYLVMNLGVFACILSMRQGGRMVESLSDLSGLSRTHPLMAAGLAVLMFAMAGIPPLAGFFSKLYVFLAAVDAGLYTLAVIGVLSSVVAAFYYLRIVKLRYFDEPVEALDRPVPSVLSGIIMVSALATAAFVFYPAPVVAAAGRAAATLIAGAM